jgi:hypothetical protein
LMFAILLAITSTLSCCALMPVAAIASALIAKPQIAIRLTS